MKLLTTRPFFIIILLLLPIFIKAKDKSTRFIAPKYILIELPTQQNRIAYFRKTGDSVNVRRLLDIQQAEIEKIVGDFNQYFAFCPHYFYVDSNRQKIKDGQWAGDLLDNHLKVIAESNLPATSDTTHFIVYYGYVQYNTEQSGVETVNVRHDYTMDEPPMIIAMNYKFRQLPNYLPYKIGHGHLPAMKDEKKEYKYKSKYFNVRFIPQALAYSYTLDEFYNNMIYTFMEK